MHQGTATGRLLLEVRDVAQQAWQLYYSNTYLVSGESTGTQIDRTAVVVYTCTVAITHTSGMNHTTSASNFLLPRRPIRLHNCAKHCRAVLAHE
jgi:hypothetical protein